jgi:hypothetical protein
VDEHEDTESYEDECEEEILAPVLRKIEYPGDDDCENSVDDEPEKKV